ncbi:MAG: type IV toxin-antitoxin system AbiEi family antitoxin domain-containing protein, partial [Gemmatimonadota bacterium]
MDPAQPEPARTQPARTDPARTDPDSIIRRLAARQHGVVTRKQLLEAGVSVYAINYRNQKKRLRRLHSGVYGVGPLSAPCEREMAAVLACGPTAMLSGGSAAALWELARSPGAGVPVEVTVRRAGRGSGGSLHVHVVRGMEEDERTELRGIPITTPARTIFDLAAASRDGREVERMVACGERLGLVTVAQMKRLLERHKGRPGTRVLCQVLAIEGGPAFVRSEAESSFRRLMTDAGLTTFETNVLFEGKERDFLWRRERLVVEVDGFAFHSSRAKFQDDRRRDRDLVKANLRVIRLTWQDITAEPLAVVADIARALALYDVGLNGRTSQH